MSKSKRARSTALESLAGFTVNADPGDPSDADPKPPTEPATVPAAESAPEIGSGATTAPTAEPTAGPEAGSSPETTSGANSAPPAEPVAKVSEEATDKSPDPGVQQGTDAPVSSGRSQKEPGKKPSKSEKLANRLYEKELERLQTELVKLQQWIFHKQLRVICVFEGRDAAGKGGAIKRITEPLNPRTCRVVALPAPSEVERTQWYFQRYVNHLPAAGEIVLFDRSWYNRAGVERVMGFCSNEDYRYFVRVCPAFERMLVADGIILIKFWFSVSDDEQERRFQKRMTDPIRRWKLSPMDMESRQRWKEFSRAKDEMFGFSDIPC